MSTSHLQLQPTKPVPVPGLASYAASASSIIVLQIISYRRTDHHAETINNSSSIISFIPYIQSGPDVGRQIIHINPSICLDSKMLEGKPNKSGPWRWVDNGVARSKKWCESLVFPVHDNRASSHPADIFGTPSLADCITSAKALVSKSICIICTTAWSPRGNSSGAFVHPRKIGQWCAVCGVRGINYHVLEIAYVHSSIESKHLNYCPIPDCRDTLGGGRPPRSVVRPAQLLRVLVHHHYYWKESSQSAHHHPQ